MKFTAARFSEAVELLQRMGIKDDPDEKRRAARMKVHFTVAIRPMVNGAPGPAIEGHLHDLSPRGLAVLLKKPFADGLVFIAELPTSGEHPQQLVCRAAHSKQQVDGMFLVGAEFIGIVNPVKPAKSEPSADEKEEERIRNSILG